MLDRYIYIDIYAISLHSDSAMERLTTPDSLPNTITHDRTFIYHNGWSGSIESPDDGNERPKYVRYIK
jgi:hypothetical protein